MGLGDAAPSPESVFGVSGGQEVQLSSPPGTSQRTGPTRMTLGVSGQHVIALDGDGDGWGGVPREGELPCAIFWSSRD